jgi:hypothetical protein
MTLTPFPLRCPWITLLGVAGLSACSGGGGGGGGNTIPPVLIAASFVGAGSSPAAGDTLLLAFSEPIALAGRPFDDADVTLSGAASLGAITTQPVLAATNALAVTLGTGVSFVPGVTTITLRSPASGTGNDAVRSAGGQLGVAGMPVVIGTSDGQSPAITRLTIAAVDSELNGTGPAGGVLQVPANGWTIDLAYNDNGAIATARTRIAASVAVLTPVGNQPPGTDLRPFLTEVAANSTAASYRVPGTVAFPNGPFTLRCLVVDESGRGSLPATFAATALAFNSARRPFETTTNASQVWFLDCSRDIESFTTTAISGGVRVNAVAGANGRADLEDLLRILGLQSATPIPNVQNGLDSNQVVLARFQQALVAELEALYDGANVVFTLTPPGGSFGSNPSVPYSSFGHSRIAIGGSSTQTGVLGIAIFDPNNQTQDDNTVVDFGGIRLGIFLHTIVDVGLGPPSTNVFRQTFGAFVPSLGGQPVGSDAGDSDRLKGVTTDARTLAIDTAIADFARFAAVVTAHECGHSMGLVQNGAMPVGLYGNDTTNFPGSSDGHIRTPNLFPPGSTNVMSPSLSYANAIHPATAFNSLNLAYLREQVTYGN